MNYVAYHKVQKMGDRLPSGPPFSILTNRSAQHLIGHDVWVIEGLGNPRQYYVRQRFRVDNIEDASIDGFRFEFSGKDGINIENHRSLRTYPWFSKFMHKVGNFGIGVVRLNDQFLPFFNEIASNACPDASHRTLDKEPQRANTTIKRIMRDTNIATRVKEIHKYKCQLCGYSILLPDGSRYVEGHHIKPLGTPHDGPDIAENIICVCPNHHVELDRFVRKIDKTSIMQSPGHTIEQRFIDYHNELVEKSRRERVAP